MRAIRLNNPGRPIPRARVLGFPSMEAASAYELANPQLVAGGLFFQRDPLGNLAFVVQSNSTVRRRPTLSPSPPAGDHQPRILPPVLQMTRTPFCPDERGLRGPARLQLCHPTSPAHLTLTLNPSPVHADQELPWQLRGPHAVHPSPAPGGGGARDRASILPAGDAYAAQPVTHLSRQHVLGGAPLCFCTLFPRRQRIPEAVSLPALQEGRVFSVADWVVSLASFAHPAVDNFSVVGIVLAPFIFAANMFGFVLAVRSPSHADVSDDTDMSNPCQAFAQQRLRLYCA